MKEPSVVSRVQEEATKVRDEGIDKVPHFNIHLKGKEQIGASLSGVQQPDAFKSVFQDLLTKFRANRV